MTADIARGSTLTHTYTAAASDVKVVCVATRAGYATLKDSLTTTVNAGAAVSLSLSVNNLTVTVVSVSGAPTSISWGDGSTATSVSDNMTHTYSASGTYTITATNSDGCKATYTVAPTAAPHTTCTVSSLNDNERGSATVIDSVRDHEGNWYEVVQIGNQCWLKENLRTTSSPSTNASLVNPLNVTGNIATQSLTSKVAHWCMNDPATYAPKGYGLLYNWCAVMDTANPATTFTPYMEVPTPTAGNNGYFSFKPSGHRRGICPKGWHVPTNDERLTMLASSEVSNNAGRLSIGCDWTSFSVANAPGNYSNSERNSSGFAAVPAGWFTSSTTSQAGYAASFWTSTQESDTRWARYWSLNCSSSSVSQSNYWKYEGRSVRCVRD